MKSKLNHMKKYTLSLMVVLMLCGTSYSQVTKSAISAALTEMGMSTSDVESFYIGNLYSYYTDGTYKKTYSKYNKTWSEGTNEVSLSDAGIVLKSFKNGALNEIRVYPYTYIVNFGVMKNYMEIYLKE